MLQNIKLGTRPLIISAPLLAVPGAAAICSFNGTMVAALLVDRLEPTYVQEPVANPKAGTAGQAFVVEKSGMTIADLDKTAYMILNLLNGRPLHVFGKQMLAAGKGVARYLYGGKTILEGYAPVPVGQWAVAQLNRPSKNESIRGGTALPGAKIQVG